MNRPPFWKAKRDASRPSRPAGDQARSSDKTHQRLDRRERVSSSDGTLSIWGMHAVEAVIANGQRAIKALHLTENAEQRLEAQLTKRGVEVHRMSPRDLDRLVGADAVHQGAVVEVEPLEEISLDASIATAMSTNGTIVVLDQVTDPHNVGAILRSAAVFGAAGLVMTRRNSPPLEGALAKAASGALELVPITLVPNLARALSEIGDAGVMRLGLDGEAETLLESTPLDQPLALVLGSEGKGLRRLTREHCDRLVRIGAAGGLASLNVSNAAAVALYAASLNRSARDQ